MAASVGLALHSQHFAKLVVKQQDPVEAGWSPHLVRGHWRGRGEVVQAGYRTLMEGAMRKNVPP